MAGQWIVQQLREALQWTEFVTMQIQQLRVRLLKIGAQVVQTVRRLWFRLASEYVWKDIFILAQQRLATDSG